MRDFHVHTSFSDGANTPEEMVRAAIAMGLTELGFSDHAYTGFDRSCCIPEERIEEYKRTISALKEKYRGQIRILCGIEQDYYSETDTAGYDYVIGSVHYVKAGDCFLSVDDTQQIQQSAVETWFGGDYYALAERYFELVGDVAEKTHADIIGHFDLVSKFNEKFPRFDEGHPRYVRAWQQAADRLIPYGKPFEISTGAISRGYRTVPYPNREMIDYIRQRGGSFLLSSDSHRADTLCYDFSRLQAEL